MKVYVVHHVYDAIIYGVFASPEAAARHRDSLNDEHTDVEECVMNQRLAFVHGKFGPLNE